MTAIRNLSDLCPKRWKVTLVSNGDVQINPWRLPAGHHHAAAHALPPSRRYGHGGVFGLEQAAIAAWAENLRATRTLLLT